MSMRDFQIIKQIGKGAFGLVYLVKRKKDNNIYALKSVQIAQLNDKEKYNSLNEVRILASIMHPNIISYKECFYDETTESLNLIMEYADDGDLQSQIQSHIKANVSFREEEIWSIFIQMIQGLKALHDTNVLHRDLKSANIFLMKNGLCKIGDMNVSKVAKLGMLYTQTGTPYYASPEVWSDKPYNYKSDIWSIGCILYELCCLKVPFKGKNFDDVYKAVMVGKYQPIPPHYSKDLSIIISLLLQVNPSNRPTCNSILAHPFVLKRVDDCLFASQDQMVGIQNKLMESIRFNSINDLNKVLPKNKNYKKPPMKCKTIDKSDSYSLIKALQNHALIRSNSQVNKPKPMTRHIRSDTQCNENLKRPMVGIDSNMQNMIYGKNIIQDFPSPNKELNHNSSVQSTNPNTKCSNLKTLQTSNKKTQHEEILKALKYQAIPRPLANGIVINNSKNINTYCNDNENGKIPEEELNQQSDRKRDRPMSCGLRKREITQQRQQVDPSKKIMINPIKIVESHNLRNLLPSHMQIKLNNIFMFTNKATVSDGSRIIKHNSNCIINKNS